MKKLEISIVIPTYNEEDNVKELYIQTKKVLDNLKKTYEIIYIDDGSTDKTFGILKKINNVDKRVRIIKFIKNYGQTAALNAGFTSSRGKVVIALDADLQNDPKDIPKLLEKIDEGYDVVSGWRYKRKDPFSKKFISFFSNIFRRLITKEEIHDSGCTLKAYKRQCLDNLDLQGEMHRFIPLLLKWKGYKIGEVKVEHHQRKSGKTKYGITRLIKGFLDLMIIKFWMQYSRRPIHLFGGLGILSFSVGFILGIYLTIMKIFYGIALSNRPILLLAILLIILGVQLVVFGVLADIMVRVYYKEKDSYKIDETL